MMPALSHAWRSQEHTGIAQLSDVHLIVPELDPRRIPYVTADRIRSVCGAGLRPPRTPEIAYLLVVCGSDWPDRQKSLDHWWDVERRAQQAFYCAVQKRWKARDTRQPQERRAELLAASLFQFGNSLHYLQDLGELGKDMGSYKDPIRREAFTAIDAQLRQLGERRLPPQPFDRRVYEDALQETSGATSPQALVAYARRQQDEGGRFFRDKLNQEPARDRPVLVRETAKGIIDMNLALGHRWVGLFLQALKGSQPDPYYLKHECRVREPDWPF
jgi:hypothetical protein